MKSSTFELGLYSNQASQVHQLELGYTCNHVFQDPSGQRHLIKFVASFSLGVTRTGYDLTNEY